MATNYTMTNPDEAFGTALANLRKASGFVGDEERKKLEQLKARESVIGQGQSLLNTAQRQGAKTGATSTSGRSQATSRSMDKILGLANETEQGVKLGQEQNELGNMLQVLRAGQGLGSAQGQLGLGQGQLDQLIRQYEEAPERMSMEQDFALARLREQFAGQKDLMDYQKSQQPGFWSRLGGGLLKLGGGALGGLLGGPAGAVAGATGAGAAGKG